MDIQKILDLESEIREIIELAQEEQSQFEQRTEKDYEFYGESDINETLSDNNPNMGSNYGSQRNLINYLESLSLNNLKVIRSLMLTGARITEEDIEDEELEELEVIFQEFYNSVPDDKFAIIDDIIKESSYLDKYLTNGLMYCLD